MKWSLQTQEGKKGFSYSVPMSLLVAQLEVPGAAAAQSEAAPKPKVRCGARAANSAWQMGCYSY